VITPVTGIGSMGSNRGGCVVTEEERLWERSVWGPTEAPTGGLDGNDVAEAVGGVEIILGGPWIRLNCLI
jgi:hypothetical protein